MDLNLPAQAQRKIYNRESYDTVLSWVKETYPDGIPFFICSQLDVSDKILRQQIKNYHVGSKFSLSGGFTYVQNKVLTSQFVFLLSAMFFTEKTIQKAVFHVYKVHRAKIKEILLRHENSETTDYSFLISKTYLLYLQPTEALMAAAIFSAMYELEMLDEMRNIVDEMMAIDVTFCLPEYLETAGPNEECLSDLFAMVLYSLIDDGPIPNVIANSLLYIIKRDKNVQDRDYELLNRDIEVSEQDVLRMYEVLYIQDILGGPALDDVDFFDFSMSYWEDRRREVGKTAMFDKRPHVEFNYMTSVYSALLLTLLQGFSSFFAEFIKYYDALSVKQVQKSPALPKSPQSSPKDIKDLELLVKQKQDALNDIELQHARETKKYKDRIERLEEELAAEKEFNKMLMLADNSKAVVDDELPIEEIYQTLAPLRIVWVGGKEGWVKGLQKRLPNIKHIPIHAHGWSNVNVHTTDLLIYQTDCLSHVMYYKFKKILRNNNIPIGYASGSDAERVIREVYSQWVTAKEE